MLKLLIRRVVLCLTVAAASGCTGDSGETTIRGAVKNPSMTEIVRSIDAFVQSHRPPSSQEGFDIGATRDCTGFKVGVVHHALQIKDEDRPNLVDLDFVGLDAVEHEDTVFFRGRIERISRTDNAWYTGGVVINGKLLRFVLLEMYASIDSNQEVVRAVANKQNDVSICGRAVASITEGGELTLSLDMLKLDNSEFRAPFVEKAELFAISSMSQADIERCVAAINVNLQIARTTVQFYGQEKAVQTMVEKIIESDGERCVLYGQESGLL